MPFRTAFVTNILHLVNAVKLRVLNHDDAGLIDIYVVDGIVTELMWFSQTNNSQHIT